jgi:hypothetical protein
MSPARPPSFFLAHALGASLALLGPNFSATAQTSPEIRVEAVLEENQIAVGITTYLQVIVQGGQPESVPNSIPAEGLTIGDPSRPPASNYAHFSVNGVVTVQAKYLYEVTGQRPGTFTIPPLRLRVRGQEHQSNPVTLEVVKLAGSGEQFNSSQPFFLTFKAAKTEAYVGELVPVELGLYVRGTNSIARPGRPEFANADKFVIKPFPTTYRLNPEQIDGIPFSNVRFPTQIAALSPGKHVLGPATVETEITPPGGGLFPRSLMRFSESRAVTSNDLTFLVKPLPPEGRPASFQGAVGSFELEVDAHPRELRVGDPLSVDIRIHGTGNFDSLTPPSVPEAPGWRTYPVTRVQPQGGEETQTLTFAQVVMPLEEHDALPSLELSFFDPAAEAYRTLRTPPIPLRMMPDPLAATRSASAALGQLGIQGEQLDDILFNHPGPPAWRPLTGSLVSRPSFWGWQLLPLSLSLGLVGHWGWNRWRAWKQEQARRFALTLDRVRAAAPHAHTRAEFYELALDYFERWKAKNRALPEGLSPKAREILDRMLQAGNSVLYAGSETASERIPPQEKHEVLSALGELETLSPMA